MNVKCVQCGDEGEGVFCSRCETILPYRDVDYFSFLGQDRRPEIDENRLTQDYHTLSLKLHPDHFQTKGSDQKSFATQWSSLLNMAYTTLKDPKLRIRYIVSLETGANMAERVEKVSSVSPAIMKLFQLVHTTCGEVDAFLEERGKVSSKIVFATMEGRARELAEKLKGVQSEIEQARNGFSVELKKIDEQWNPASKPPNALIEKLETVGADLSHLSKFDSLVEERLISLSLQ